MGYIYPQKLQFCSLWTVSPCFYISYNMSHELWCTGHSVQFDLRGFVYDTKSNIMNTEVFPKFPSLIYLWL